uniref:ATP synthase complex subunit 8 n=1 Tax=Apoderus coryli TaxID=201766 RepID=J9PHB1_APOCO|nr:ATP synthase F0 subunit 8 [Apoderus coryli]
MPQMAPLNWTSLFIYFIVIFFFFNVMTYFLTTNKSINNKIIFKK